MNWLLTKRSPSYYNPAYLERQSFAENMFYSEHDRFFVKIKPSDSDDGIKRKGLNIHKLIKRYGAQRAWYHFQWYQKLIEHDRVGKVFKPKGADWAG